MIGGAPGACIAVTCDAGTIGGCDGSDELVCSATGTTYVTKSCANGCDPIAGCLECAPNQSVCTTDGNFQTCDGTGSATTMICPHVCDATAGCLDCQPNAVTCTADGSAVETCSGSGAVASTDACTLGCGSDGGAHCTQLVPSNGLQMFYDMVPNPVDLTFSNGELAIGSDSAKFFPNAGGAAAAVTVFRAAAPLGGAPVAIIVGHNITLNNVQFANGDLDLDAGGFGPAVAFLATGDLVVSGPLLLQSGAVNIPGCNGGSGMVDSSHAEPHAGGGAGGANATDGADGGTVLPSVTGGAHGTATGGDDLIPLKGGCPGGLPRSQFFGGNGGGAAQLVSLSSIRISAPVIADGNWLISNTGGPGAGGGAGGSILIEAPSVALEAGAALLARGGNGYAGDGNASAPADLVSAFVGGVCDGGGGRFCSNGGNGGTATAPPTAGSNTSVAVPSDEVLAGGGGGGVGRVRINTRDGMFSQASAAIIAARITTGVAASR